MIWLSVTEVKIESNHEITLYNKNPTSIDALPSQQVKDDGLRASDMRAQSLAHRRRPSASARTPLNRRHAASNIVTHREPLKPELQEPEPRSPSLPSAGMQSVLVHPSIQRSVLLSTLASSCIDLPDSVVLHPEGRKRGRKEGAVYSGLQQTPRRFVIHSSPRTVEGALMHACPLEPWWWQAVRGGGGGGGSAISNGGDNKQ